MKKLIKILFISGLLIFAENTCLPQSPGTPTDTTRVSQNQNQNQNQTQTQTQTQTQKQNQAGNQGVKQVKSARPDMTKAKGARPSNIVRPSGSAIPKGVGKPGGAGRFGGR